MTSRAERLAVLTAITREVAALALERFQDLHTVTVETKGVADYVSRVDREAEALARRLIAEAYPEDAVVGEEGGGQLASACWIVDPVDGTANFLSGLPLWAVSIAFLEHGKPDLGAVAVPALDMLVSGGLGLGITASYPGNVASPSTPIAFGIGRNRIWPLAERLALEQRLEDDGYHIVSLGSCATSLAFVAIGRLAGYVENGVKLWDCAGGQVLCQEAGLNPILSPCGPDHVSIAVSRSKQVG